MAIIDPTSVRNYHRDKLRQATAFNNRGVWMYASKALQAEYDDYRKKGKDKIAPFSEPYEVNPFGFQYDLEVHLFLNYEDIKNKELELCEEKYKEFIEQHGPTGFTRDEHYWNACKIRWPTRKLPDGSLAGNFVRNPWAEDTARAICNYTNIIKFGGSGQGKSYEFIAFMCILFDYYLYTQKGAQCTYSTTSESKLNQSTWPYVNKLYPIESGREQFSLYAGKAKKSGDYTFKRVDPATKKTVDKGSKFTGVLLQRGRNDSLVIDKLTGAHDVEARAYLLDEMQSTDDAPINAYTNMFMKPKKGWFFGCGNYEDSSDLLAINIEPKRGWSTVDEKTHTWESLLRSKANKVNQTVCVLHLNNELSPALTSDEGAILYKNCCPNRVSRDKLYPNDEATKSYAYKRFWVGFRFEKEADNSDYVVTAPLIKSSGCYIRKHLKNPLAFGSFDSATASKDRNVFGISHLDDGPFVNIEKFITNDKPEDPLKYYKHTVDFIIKTCKEYDIASGNMIMDWTQRTALIENLSSRGFYCHHLTYHEKIPDKIGKNVISGERERPIDLGVVNRFSGTLEKTVKMYAHNRLRNKITLGAYVFSLFVESGLVGNLNETLFTRENSSHDFEKEMLLRKFKKGGMTNKTSSDQRLILVSKDEFKSEYGFSPDALDTVYQLFYMLYVHKEVRPHIKSIERLRVKKYEMDELIEAVSSAVSVHGVI